MHIINSKYGRELYSYFNIDKQDIYIPSESYTNFEHLERYYINCISNKYAIEKTLLIVGKTIEFILFANIAEIRLDPLAVSILGTNYNVVLVHPDFSEYDFRTRLKKLHESVGNLSENKVNEYLFYIEKQTEIAISTFTKVMSKKCRDNQIIQ